MCYSNKMLTLILLSQILVVLQGKLQPRIISGYTCDTTEVPFFVIIETHVDPRSHCGGSLLTYDWVLTAAHCISPKLLEGGTSTVYSGFDMPPQLRQVRYAKEFHMHPKFDDEDLLNTNDFRYDIGLVLVDEPFRQTVATNVVTLPVPGFAKKCTRAMTPGVGVTYNEEFVWTKPLEQRPLKCVDLSIVNTNSCKEDYARAVDHKEILFDDTVMCMLASGRGVCKGDSGGPVLCDNVVIGINSVAPEDCESTPIASTFMMIESHLDFIHNIVKSARRHST